LIALKINTLFEVQNYGFAILADQHANLFWKTKHSKINPLIDLPWKFQMPFFLTILHDDNLAERFKNFEILGAIDLYIKGRYLTNKELDLYH